MSAPARSTALNALSASAQMAVTTGAGLFYFGYLLRVLGPEALGGWLAWLALGMVACLADLGLRESLVRRTAVANGQRDDQGVVALLDTTVLTVAVSMVLALALLMALGPLLLPPGPAREASPLLVAGVALMVWLQRVADAHAAALEGLQRYDLVARNNVLGALAGLATLLASVPAWGVAAASLGLIVQYTLSGLAHAAVLRRLLPTRRGWLPQGYSARLAREGLGYGLSVQAAIGSFVLIESITKILLARQDALALLAYYDLAFRVGRGLRNLLVAGNRVLVPRLAQAEARGEGGATASSEVVAEVRSLYLRSFHLLLFLAVPIFSLALAAAGMVSMLTRGSVDPMLVLAFALTLPAWFVFCAVDPVINVGMGTGAMRPVVLAHVAMLLLLALIGLAWWLLSLFGLPALTPRWAGPATLAAALLAIVLPCLGLLRWYHREHRLPLALLQPWRSGAVVLGAWAAAGAVHLLAPRLWVQMAGWLGAAVVTLLLLRALPAWQPLMRGLGRTLARRRGGG